MHRSRNASNSASVPLSSVSTIWPTRALIASPPCCAAAGMIAQAKSAPTAITNRRARPNCQPAIGGLPVLTSGTRLHLRGRVKPAAARNSLAKQGQYLTQPVAHPCTCDGGGNGHADFEDHGENDVGHRLAPIAPQDIALMRNSEENDQAGADRGSRPWRASEADAGRCEYEEGVDHATGSIRPQRA